LEQSIIVLLLLLLLLVSLLLRSLDLVDVQVVVFLLTCAIALLQLFLWLSQTERHDSTMMMMATMIRALEQVLDAWRLVKRSAASPIQSHKLGTSVEECGWAAIGQLLAHWEHHGLELNVAQVLRFVNVSHDHRAFILVELICYWIVNKLAEIS